MAAKDFQELIKSQMETTRALLSAEEAANYDTIIAERQLQFDKNNEKARKAADTRKDNAARRACSSGCDANSALANGMPKVGSAPSPRTKPAKVAKAAPFKPT